MIKAAIRRSFAALGRAKAGIFHGNQIGPQSSFALSADIRRSELRGRNYIGQRSVVHKCLIGEYSYLGNDCRLVNVEVGMFASIGSGVKTSFGRHPYHFLSQHPATYSTGGDTPTLAGEQLYPDEHSFASAGVFVSIGHDVWIGDDVNILDGVRVGHGAVIGTNALVTCDVPPYAVVLGVPGKVLKYRFPQDVITRLLALEWWSWNRALLRQAIDQQLLTGEITALEKFFAAKGSLKV